MYPGHRNQYSQGQRHRRHIWKQRCTGEGEARRIQSITAATHLLPSLVPLLEQFRRPAQNFLPLLLSLRLMVLAAKKVCTQLFLSLDTKAAASVALPASYIRTLWKTDEDVP